MAEQNNRDMTNRANANDESSPLSQSHRNEHTARQLSHEALLQWEKAINGILAIPAAVALTTAANALYMAAFIERGFEAFQASAEAVGRELDHQMRGHLRAGNGDWASNRESARQQS